MNILIAGRDYDLDLPKGYLSPSQIEKYLHCPEQYRRTYVEKAEMVYTEPLAEGQAFHTVMKETNLSRYHKKKHLTLKQAISLHKKACKEEAAKVDGRADVDSWLTRGSKFLTQAWGRKEQPIWQPCRMDGNVPGVEWEWKLELAGVPLVGIADLVEDTNCTDFKVASTARYYSAEHSIQANLNRLATNRERFLFEVFEKQTGKRQLVSHKVDDLDRVRTWMEFVVSQVAHGISTGCFPPTAPEKNTLCDKRWCSFWSTCVGAR